MTTEIVHIICNNVRVVLRKTDGAFTPEEYYRIGSAFEASLQTVRQKGVLQWLNSETVLLLAKEYDIFAVTGESS